MSHLKTRYNQYLEEFGDNLNYDEWLEYEIRKKDEEIAKLKNRKKPKMPNCKKIQQLRPTDMLVIGEYSSISEASKLTNINRVSISLHISKPLERKQAGGFIWRVKK